jgi:glucokinase
MAFNLLTFIADNGTALLTGINNIAHSWITTKKDKQINENDAKELEFQIQQFISDSNQKAIEAAQVAQAAENQNITSRWQSDMTSDSWLSKNVRPLVLISLLSFTFLLILIDSFHFRFAVSDQWISVIKDLLLTTFIAYFGSRGIEKVTSIKK